MLTDEPLLYIVPAYNEGGTIGGVVQQVQELSLSPDEDVVVVDDCSSDDTREKAEEAGATVISHPINLGGGAALRTGMRYAARNGYSYVLCIDGDGQHDPQYAEDVLSPVVDGDADLSIGSRFLGEAGYDVPPVRLAGIKTYSAIVSILSGETVTDCTSGYRAMNRELFEQYAANYPDNFWAIEATIWAGRNGYRIEEVPVTMAEREEGESHLSGFRMAKYPFSMVYAILRAL